MKVPRLAQRILRERGEVLLLELVFERDPVGPHRIERLAEHMLELARIKRPRSLGPAKPFDGRLDTVCQRQIGKEAGAVEVGIGTRLEVDLGTFAFQPERRKEAQWSCTFARNTISS